MRRRGLYFLCVFVVVVCAVSGEGFTSEEERIIRSAKTSQPRTFYIYPRSGRLFHADYVRDNEIFRSLKRTNFQRVEEEGLRRTKREDESEVKKYTYVNEGRIPGGKKSVMGKVRRVPLKVVTKISDFLLTEPEEARSRSKRETMLSEGIELERPLAMQNGQIKSSNSKESEVEDFGTVIPAENSANASILKANKHNFTKDTENKVEGDHNTHSINNDTDKTLFLLDLVQQKDQPPVNVKIPQLDLLQDDLMKKLVIDDSLSLYPVYTGVKYANPRSERSLQYAPEITVQMDKPEVTDDVVSSQNNSTSDFQEEGRGRRRRIKKLAFPLLLALKLKAVLMLPLILGLISLVAFKGLWSGLTALGVAAALGLKALVGSGAPRVVVQAPPLPTSHYHHSPPHEYTEYWSRRDDFSDYRPSSWS